MKISSDTGLRRRSLWLYAALALLAALWSGCKVEEPYPLELTPTQTQVLGLNFMALPEDGLVDQNGAPVSFEKIFANGKKPALMTEIYTSCPEPDMCPMLMSKMARAVAHLTEQGVAPHSYQLIIMSLDPARDTPDKMQHYADAHGISSENLHLITGDKATIEAVMKKLEVGIRQAPDGTFMHSMRTYVVGGDGRVTHGFRQSGWEPAHLAKRLKSQL